MKNQTNSEIKKYDYVEVTTWTTDGFYRETKEKMEKLQKRSYFHRDGRSIHCSNM